MTSVTLMCSYCGKKLSRKKARLIDGKVMCSTCMFKPESERGKGKQ